MAADTVDALIAADPEVIVQILQNLKRSVAEQSVRSGEVGKNAVAQTRDTGIVGPEPERALGIFVDRADIVAGESVALRVRDETRAVQARDTLRAARPYRSIARLINQFDVVSGKTVGRGKAARLTAIVAHQAELRGKPECARLVLVYGPHRSVRNIQPRGDIGKPAICVVTGPADETDPEPSVAILI